MVRSIVSGATHPSVMALYCLSCTSAEKSQPEVFSLAALHLLLLAAGDRTQAAACKKCWLLRKRKRLKEYFEFPPPSYDVWGHWYTLTCVAFVIATDKIKMCNKQTNATNKQTMQLKFPKDVTIYKSHQKTNNGKCWDFVPNSLTPLPPLVVC